MSTETIGSSDIVRRLTEGGLPPRSAEQKRDLIERCLAVLSSRKESASEISAFFAPGRIEVLGKHTDYAGGDSLLCAVSHGFVFFAIERETGSPLTIVNAATGESIELSPDTSEAAGSRRGHWSNYPDTVWRRLISNAGRTLRGGLIVFDSDLPPSSGISSSSALVVGTFLCLDHLNGLLSSEPFRSVLRNREALGDYLGCVENGRDYPGLPGTSGVGTTGGSEDQTAILCARSGELQHFSFSPTTFRHSVGMPDGQVFVIASSGVFAEKTGKALSFYNRVGARASAIVEVWNRRHGTRFATLGDIVRQGDFDPAAMRRLLLESESAFAPESLAGRFEQFFRESFEIIPAAVASLEEKDLVAFAGHVAESQRLAELHLENQVPETIALVQLALEEGAAAASAFGAGFGGSVWAITDEVGALEFLSRWSARYRMLFPASAAHSRFFVERPGPGAFSLA